MPHLLFPANDRGTKDIGWLKSNFTFSFSSYYNPSRSGFGLMRVFNDDYMATGGGFGLHPHENMEIISVVLSGSMRHRDTMGYDDTVHRDWVQIMSAGSGLRHEEHNAGEEEVNFLQIWIEPKLQNITPRYQRRHFPEAARRNRLVTAVSYEPGQAHCWINQQARLLLGAYDAGQEISFPAGGTNLCWFIFAIDGSLTVNGERIGPRDALGFWDVERLDIRTEAASRFVLFEMPVNH